MEDRMPTSAGPSLPYLLKRLADRRKDLRRELVQGIPGYLLTESGERLAAGRFSVSRRGLGFSARRELNKGAMLMWIVDDRAHKLVVLYSGQGESGDWRCGVEALDPRLDVEAIVQDAMRASNSPWDP
jgi:hypothetical protein